MIKIICLFLLLSPLYQLKAQENKLFDKKENSSINNSINGGPTTPEICMIQVDSLSENNVIYWDKTLYATADTFYIYRDTANNNYALIGKVPYDSLSLFNDTLRSLYSANGDPNLTSWKYKIAYHDNVSNTMSAMSPWHQSIYQYNVGGLFIWNHYQVEGQVTPVPGLTNYLLMRDNISGTGNWVVAATASSSSTNINDPQYATYQNTADWKIETLWATTCDPTRTTISTTRSNIKRSNFGAGIKRKENKFFINISPNPAKDNISVDIVGFSSTSLCNFKIYNSQGQIISNASINGDKANIDVSHLSKGLYLLECTRNNTSEFKKFIKE